MLFPNVCNVQYVYNSFIRRKRSQSSSDDLDESPNAEFKRGGVRATAGPRLGWSHDLQRRNNKYI